MIRFPSFFAFLLLTLQLLVQIPTAVSTPLIRHDETPPECVNGHCAKRCLQDIIVGCLTTTVVCAWTAVHPNIPTRHGSLNGFLRRLQLMFWTVVAPELLPCWALNQLLAAMTVRNVYNKRKGYVNGRSSLWETVKGWVSMNHTTGASQAWTLWHGHFLVMGGFHLVEPDGTTPPRTKTRIAQTAGNVQATNASLDYDIEQTQPYRLTGRQGSRVTILTLELLKDLVDDPEFEIEATQDEIMDKSKGDALSKFIFVMQTSWFIVQCIGRHVQGLDLTVLELTTLGLASLNGITILLWWHKPLDAQTPICVYLRKPLTRNLRPRSILGETITLWSIGRLGFVAVILGVVANACREPIFVACLILLLPLTLLLVLLALILAFCEHGLNILSDLVGSSRVPADHIDDTTFSNTFYVPKHQYSEYWHLLLLVVLGSTFGTIHCAGWNFPFPTHTYQLLWRIASLIVTTIPITIPTTVFITLIIRNFKNAVLRESTRFELPSLYEIAVRPQIVVAISGSTYIVARFILLGLALVLLKDQPPSALIDIDWIKYYPHF